jgi:hypothetical protein
MRGSVVAEERDTSDEMLARGIIIKNKGRGRYCSLFVLMDSAVSSGRQDKS